MNKKLKIFISCFFILTLTRILMVFKGIDSIPTISWAKQMALSMAVLWYIWFYLIVISGIIILYSLFIIIKQTRITYKLVLLLIIGWWFNSVGTIMYLMNMEHDELAFHLSWGTYGLICISAFISSLIFYGLIKILMCSNEIYINITYTIYYILILIITVTVITVLILLLENNFHSIWWLFFNPNVDYLI